MKSSKVYRILLISHWFPPANVIGSVRPYQIAKFFTEKGYDVKVICAGNTAHNQDWIADTSDFETIRVTPSRIVLFLDPGGKSNAVVQLLKALLRRLLFPDQYIIDHWKYWREFNQLERNNWRPDIVISSAMPFSIHLIAMRISSYLTIPWIADNRDLWASSPYRSRFPWMRRIEYWFERKVLTRASICTCIGERMTKILYDTLGGQCRVLTVRNGADVGISELNFQQPHTESEISDIPRTNYPIRLVYTGGLYGGYRDAGPLFEALIKNQKEVEFYFYTSEKKVVDMYRTKFPDYTINWHPKVSKDAIKDVQNTADILVLILGNHPFEKTVITGKFFEYLEARKPILAICDEDSELAELITSFGLGIATRKAKNIADYVTNFLITNKKIKIKIPVELTRFFQLSFLEKEVLLLCKNAEKKQC